VSRFVDEENAIRLDAYRKAEADEETLRAANLALQRLEPAGPLGPPLPTLYVFGLPRSGTTLCAQLLTGFLDLAYISNLAARFWLAPSFGLRLARLVAGERRDTSLESDYGKTAGPWGVHEFAYFWHRWLGIETTDDLLRFGRPNPVDWQAAGIAVQRVVDAAGAPVLFKTNFAGQFLTDFAESMPQPLFISVERDAADVALSILAARRRYYGREDAWWATHPPEYPSLQGRPVAEQIAGQVVGLRRAYDRAVDSVDPRLVLRLEYRHVCADPAGALATVQERLHSLYDVAVAGREAPPHLAVRTHDGARLDQVQVELLERLDTALRAAERAL
jgi:sulfotransferase family protein